ncbi:hypothetical protein [Lactococcus allomyrinae]|uniref:Uncharacterized protein n=1 Tax=Lactococcus allomyrinae TaxID=2419773 RepID=A0A387BCR9_9LACT|nr:hypothetical protein [Lactococcus allomyrinae]AYF99811.1 hypothetical protein D7I46_01150 [Lactococcus allomyrinae]
MTKKNIKNVDGNLIIEKVNQLEAMECPFVSLEDYIAFQLYMDGPAIDELVDKFIPHLPERHNEVAEALAQRISEFSEIMKKLLLGTNIEE